MSRYFEIGGGYKAAILTVGAVLVSPAGREVYFQPGDDAAIFGETLAALDEISEDASDPARGRVADIAFSEYFD